MDRGAAAPLSQWFERELDPEGVPRLLGVGSWLEGLRILDRGFQERPGGWPDPFDAVAESWFRATLRFSRGDGSPAMGPPGTVDLAARRLFREWAGRLADPGLATVVDWWFPAPIGSDHAPPPLPADSRPDRPLAVLRASWRKDGDLIAVDHRIPGLETRFELLGGGIPWLSGAWSSPPPEKSVKIARACPTLWVSKSAADVFEWSFAVGRARVTRTAVFLRGRMLALLAEQWEGPGDPGETRWGLAGGVDALPMPEGRGWILRRDRLRLASRVLPIGLDREPDHSKPGGLVVEDGALVLRQPPTPGCSWRPLLISWEPRRDRRPIDWRRLTVSEGPKACGPEAAFAARVNWGRDEGLVIYRSLAAPATRAFLGHQTRSAFLIGLFNREGDVEPLVKLDALAGSGSGVDAPRTRE